MHTIQNAAVEHISNLVNNNFILGYVIRLQNTVLMISSKIEPRLELK